MNVLWIMYDQLRHDYLGCAGHPTLRTPNFDRLAARGVRFSNAYTQSPICGPARMSAYTGRYVSSHGASWNGVPLRVGEPTLGDHLRAGGTDCWLIGKTHMRADAAGMARLGLEPDSIIGARQAECGFDVWVRDDGLWGEGPDGPYDRARSPYNAYLTAKGYGGDNPWADFANAAADGPDLASGWFMQNARKPANIREEDSETPWLTTQAIEFLDQAADGWVAHLSYIKPHWPYIVPAPYHDLYGPGDIQPVQRDPAELDDPHPVYAAFTGGIVGRNFARDDVRETVIPAYMGLIAQCDDQLGRLLDHLEATGRIEDTLIVLTSDHGDYLGDHWMGEKELFHAPSVKVPLVVVDPRSSADGTRGHVVDAPVEVIDVTATIIEAAGGTVPEHIVEGRALGGFLTGAPPERRDYVVSEYDYSRHPAATQLNLAPRDARLFMIATRDWKLVHCEGGLRPMLFDLVNDPHEYRDLGADAGYARVRAEMYDRLHEWSLRMSQRITISDADILRIRQGERRTGIVLGLWDGSETDPAATARYRGRVPKRPPD